MKTVDALTDRVAILEQVVGKWEDQGLRGRANGLGHQTAAAHDRLDRLEFRLKYGDSAYADYAQLRSDGLNHAQAARAERTATKRAVVTQEARSARHRDQVLADQDDAMKDEVLRSLARDVQELAGVTHQLRTRLESIEARFNQVTESEACPTC